MPYECEILKDSIGPNNIRLTTMRVRMPRRVWAELLTHRQFSRNAKSSRAKPVIGYIKEVIQDYAKVLYWGENRKGMQAGESESKYKNVANIVWNTSRWIAILCAFILNKLKVHKQVVNRLLEPFIYIDGIITGIDWAWINFFALRAGSDGGADPELQKIARMAARIYRDSVPTKLKEGYWHLPYITNDDYDNAKKYINDPSNYENNIICVLLKISTARCARISYNSFDQPNKKSSIQDDLNLYEKLIKSDPKHASAAEHQAMATELEYCNPNFTTKIIDGETYYTKYSYDIKKSGNLYGWYQYRKIIPNEVNKTFDFEGLTNEEFIIR